MHEVRFAKVQTPRGRFERGGYTREKRERNFGAQDVGPLDRGANFGVGRDDDVCIGICGHVICLRSCFVETQISPIKAHDIRQLRIADMQRAHGVRVGCNREGAYGPRGWCEAPSPWGKALVDCKQSPAASTGPGATRVENALGGGF
jgi:hypothetical protein